MSGKVTAAHVIAALRNGPWSEPAHAWLLEVRDKTGYGEADRFADALVVSCYPSRGIWFAGVEVKVSRSDWKRELADPTKTAIQKFCDFWWVAAPPGIIELSELPETWGLMVVDGAKAKAAKPAPRLKPEPHSATFVASVLRNLAKRQSIAIDRAYADGRRVGEAKAEKDQQELWELREKVRGGGAEAIVARLTKQIAEFETSAGLPPGTVAGEPPYYFNNAKRTGAFFAAAQAFTPHSAYQLDGLEKDLREAADKLAEIRKIGIVR